MRSTFDPKMPPVSDEQIKEIEKRYRDAGMFGMGFSITYVDERGNLVTKALSREDVEEPRR